MNFDKFIDTITGMNNELLLAACNLYNTLPNELTPLTGGHYNAVYQFPRGDAFAILRIGVEESPSEQTLGMLEWVSYLHQAGAPVTAPLVSSRGNLLEQLEHDGKRYTITAFENAVGTLAENIPPSEWSDELFQAIGKAVGKFHAISKQYQPSPRALTRPHWFDSYEVREAIELLTKSNNPAKEKLDKLLSELMQLPTDLPNYGMIHADLHFANFLILPNDQVAIIDFDDCGYGWFAMDVAMALFDILVLADPTDETEKGRIAQRFMHNYLSGYHQETELPKRWQSMLPRFLKLKELCIYSTLIDHPEIHQPESWVGRFMRRRAERIALDTPYVDIDFLNL